MKAAELFVKCLENAELQQNFPALRLLQWRQKLGGLLQNPMSQPAVIVAELALSSAAAFTF